MQNDLVKSVSQEEDLEESHTIIPDGYNIGRDKLVSQAIGTTHFDGVTYVTTARNLTGLLAAGSAGYVRSFFVKIRNANKMGFVPSESIMVRVRILLQCDGVLTRLLGISTDGITTLLTVTIVEGVTMVEGDC